MARARSGCWVAMVLLAGLAAALPSRADSQIIIVTEDNLQGWQISNYDAVTHQTTSAATTSGTFGSFAPGPTDPPLGAGSFRQRVGTNPADAQFLATGRYNGRLVASFTALSYWTYVSRSSPTDQEATFLVFVVDLNVDGRFDPSVDDLLIFEPWRQSIPACPERCVLHGTWQGPWDADTVGGGRWRSALRGVPAGLVTLADYARAHPTAALVQDRPALQLVAGMSNGSFANFEGYVDRLEVDDTLWDFEGGRAGSPSPAPTPTPQPTPSPTPAPTPTPTPAPTFPASPTPTATPPCHPPRADVLLALGPYYLRLDGIWQETNGYAGLQVMAWQCNPGPLVPPDTHLVAVP